MEETDIRPSCYSSYSVSKNNLKETEEESETKRSSSSSSKGKSRTRIVTELGNGSQLVYIPQFFISSSTSASLSLSSWEVFEYLNKHIPWTRPTIRIFGRSCLQPRDTCYVASGGLEELSYSGYQPHAYSWDHFPPLKLLLDAVHDTFPGSCFNSLLLNRYKGGNDYVSWHADDEKLYGPTPLIASLSFGCDREFLLKKKSTKTLLQAKRDEPSSKRLKKSLEQHSIMLKHGSLLMMTGYTQRDWLHSVPKCAKADATRINLTFRRVL